MEKIKSNVNVCGITENGEVVFDGPTSSSCGGYYINNGFLLSNKEPTEQFKIIYELIKKGVLSCEEAWLLILNIMPKETQYIPYPYTPISPFNPIEPYYQEPSRTNDTPYWEQFKIWCTSTSNGSTEDVK